MVVLTLFWLFVFSNTGNGIPYFIFLISLGLEENCELHYWLFVDRFTSKNINRLFVLACAKVFVYAMAFLDSPILKTRRLGAISPETQRKFTLARAPPTGGDCSDFLQLHKNIACSNKSYALLDVNARENALKVINQSSKKHTDQLETLRDSFNKVKVNEKVGFNYDEQVVSDVREKILAEKITLAEKRMEEDKAQIRAEDAITNDKMLAELEDTLLGELQTIGMLDPMGGMSSISLSRCSSNHSFTLRADLTEDASTLKPINQFTEDYSDTSDTESILSDFEMEIINISADSADFEESTYLAPLDLESPVSDGPDTHVSQKSIILSAGGMYSIDTATEEGGEEYAMVSSVVMSSPTAHEEEEEEEEVVKPRCDTCASWDAATWDATCKAEEEEEKKEDGMNMVIGTTEKEPVKIAVFRSPLLPRRALEDEVCEPLCEKLLALEVEDTDDEDFTKSRSISLSESLETKSLDSCDFEQLDFSIEHDTEEFMEFQANVDLQNRSKNRFISKIKNDRVKSLVTQATNLVHSASADFSRFGLKRSDSTASIRKARPSSTSTFYKPNVSRTRIPRPNYDLSSTLLPQSPSTDTLNLDSRLRLGGREVVEVEPLPRWNIKPSFATTTAGHKAWYQRAQTLIESRRKEIANAGILDGTDLDILVSTTIIVHYHSPLS